MPLIQIEANLSVVVCSKLIPPSSCFSHHNVLVSRRPETSYLCLSCLPESVLCKEIPNLTLCRLLEIFTGALISVLSSNHETWRNLCEASASSLYAGSLRSQQTNLSDAATQLCSHILACRHFPESPEPFIGPLWEILMVAYQGRAGHSLSVVDRIALLAAVADLTDTSEILGVFLSSRESSYFVEATAELCLQDGTEHLKEVVLYLSLKLLGAASREPSILESCNKRVATTKFIPSLCRVVRSSNEMSTRTNALALLRFASGFATFGATVGAFTSEIVAAVAPLILLNDGDVVETALDLIHETLDRSNACADDVGNLVDYLLEALQLRNSSCKTLKNCLVVFQLVMEKWPALACTNFSFKSLCKMLSSPTEEYSLLASSTLASMIRVNKELHTFTVSEEALLRLTIDVANLPFAEALELVGSLLGDYSSPELCSVSINMIERYLAQVPLDLLTLRQFAQCVDIIASVPFDEALIAVVESRILQKFCASFPEIVSSLSPLVVENSVDVIRSYCSPTQLFRFRILRKITESKIRCPAVNRLCENLVGNSDFMPSSSMDYLEHLKNELSSDLPVAVGAAVSAICGEVDEGSFEDKDAAAQLLGNFFCVAKCDAHHFSLIAALCTLSTLVARPHRDIALAVSQACSHLSIDSIRAFGRQLSLDLLSWMMESPLLHRLSLPFMLRYMEQMGRLPDDLLWMWKQLDLDHLADLVSLLLSSSIQFTSDFCDSLLQAGVSPEFGGMVISAATSLMLRAEFVFRPPLMLLWKVLALDDESTPQNDVLVARVVLADGLPTSQDAIDLLCVLLFRQQAVDVADCFCGLDTALVSFPNWPHHIQSSWLPLCARLQGLGKPVLPLCELLDTALSLIMESNDPRDAIAALFITPLPLAPEDAELALDSISALAHEKEFCFSACCAASLLFYRFPSSTFNLTSLAMVTEALSRNMDPPAAAVLGTAFLCAVNKAPGGMNCFALEAAPLWDLIASYFARLPVPSDTLARRVVLHFRETVCQYHSGISSSVMSRVQDYYVGMQPFLLDDSEGIFAVRGSHLRFTNSFIYSNLEKSVE